MPTLFHHSKFGVEQFDAPLGSNAHFYGEAKSHQVLLSRKSGAQCIFAKGQIYHPGISFPDYFQSFDKWTILENLDANDLNEIQHVSCIQNETVIVKENEIIFWSSLNPILRKTSNWIARMPFSEKIIRVESGINHHIFLTEQGSVYSCGSNASCALGIVSEHSPLGYPTKVPLEVKIISIACGNNHSVLLSEAGRVYVCGLNEFGALGIPTLGQSPQFVLCSSLLRYQIVKIGCGSQYTIVLTNEGMLLGMGQSTSGQLLVNMSRCDKPKKFNALMNYTIRDFACSDQYVVCITDTNRILVWGTNIFGREKNSFFVPKEIFLNFPSPIFRIVGSANGTWFVCEQSSPLSPTGAQSSNLSSLSSIQKSKFEVNLILQENSHEDPSQSFMSWLKKLNDTLQMHRPQLLQLQVNLKTLLHALHADDNAIDDCIDDCLKATNGTKLIHDIKNIALNILSLFKKNHLQHTASKITSQLLISSIDEWILDYTHWKELFHQCTEVAKHHRHAPLLEEKRLFRITSKLQKSHEETQSLLKVIHSQLRMHVNPLQSPQRNPPTLNIVSGRSHPNNVRSSHQNSDTRQLNQTSYIHHSQMIQRKSASLNTSTHDTNQFKHIYPNQYIEDTSSVELTEMDYAFSDVESVLSSNIDEILESPLEKSQLLHYEQSLKVSLSSKMNVFDQVVRLRLESFLDKISTMAKTLSYFRSKHEDIVRSYTQFRKKIASLEKDNLDLRQALQLRIRSQSQLEMNHIELEKRNIKEKQRFEEIITRLNQSQSQSDDDVSTFQYQIGRLKTENDKANEKMILLHKEIQDLKDTNSKLKEKYYILSSKAEANQKGKDNLIEELRTELQATQARYIEKINSHKQDLLYIYRYISKQYQTSTFHMETASKKDIGIQDIQALCENVSSFHRKDEYNALQRKYKECEMELKNAQEKVKFLHEELNKANETLDSVSDSKNLESILREEIKSAHDQNASLSATYSDLKQAYAKLQYRDTQSQHEIEILNSTIIQLQGEKAKAEDVSSGLEKQLHKKILSLNEKHVETLNKEKSMFEAELNSIKSMHQAELEDLKSKLADEKNHQQEQFEAEIERLKNDHRNELQRAIEQYIKELHRTEDLNKKEISIRDVEVQKLKTQVQTIQSLHHESLNRILLLDHSSLLESSTLSKSKVEESNNITNIKKESTKIDLQENSYMQRLQKQKETQQWYAEEMKNLFIARYGELDYETHTSSNRVEMEDSFEYSRPDVSIVQSSSPDTQTSYFNLSASGDSIEDMSVMLLEADRRIRETLNISS